FLDHLCGGSSPTGFLLATASSRRLTLFGLTVLLINLIVIHQLDESHLSVITQPVLQLYNPRVTSGAGSHLFGYLTEQYRYRFLVLQVAEYGTARMRRVVLGFRNQRLYILAKRFGFGQCCRNAFVLNQRGSHVRQHRLAMTRCAP